MRDTDTSAPQMYPRIGRSKRTRWQRCARLTAGVVGRLAQRRFVSRLICLVACNSRRNYTRYILIHKGKMHPKRGWNSRRNPIHATCAPESQSSSSNIIGEWRRARFVLFFLLPDVYTVYNRYKKCVHNSILLFLRGQFGCRFQSVAVSIRYRQCNTYN